jgi:hypothetical protein
MRLGRMREMGNTDQAARHEDAPPDSSGRHTGHSAYDLDELRGDLERFVFLLGGSDGGPLFSP